MSILHNSIKRSVVNVHVKDYHEEDTDLLGNICRTSSLDCEGSGGEVIAGANMEAEKRIRREIANSNERRRMQSINAGFQSLRTLLPHHEGEKLSKAAILQQTAEYIYNLEQEKTRLLSQNCQLMRQVQQHEGDVPPKKRIKNEQLLLATINATTAIATATTTNESSDEGLGSMSPEPIVTLKQQTKIVSVNEITELRRQLERERTLRIHLEEQIRSMSMPMPIQMEYHHEHEHEHEHEHGATETIITTSEDDIEMQLIQAENIPLVGQTETVVCCSPPSPISMSMSMSMSRCSSPVSRPTTPPIPIATVTAATATATQQRLPSALEAAIKAEPKVEVERLPSASPTPNANVNANTNDDVVCNRLYVANNTSRQNLETIVEAIRHLEGDHLFSDEPSTTTTSTSATAIVAKQQDVPLALTTTTKSIKVIIPTQQTKTIERLKAATIATTTATTTPTPQQQKNTAIKVEMNHYLQFHNQQQQQQQHIHQAQQSRPGVIVVKQHS